MDQGGVFVILFKMVRYHQKKYPSYIPLHLEEVAGHFDVRRVFPTLPYSLHTEYSYSHEQNSKRVVIAMVPGHG